MVFEFVEKRLGIDDVCAVFPVYGSAGMLGAVLLGVPVLTVPGAGVSLVSQLVGVAAIAGWTALATLAVFGVLRALGQIRVARDHEIEGLDLSEHGVETYSEFDVGEEYTVDLHGKVKIECVVGEVPAADVADAIVEAAYMGQPGDGKVFVLPVEHAVQVRTGKEGVEAV